MPSSEALRRRGRLNALRRYRRDDDPDVLDAERDLAAERLAEHVRRVVDQAPPLTAAQRDRIAALLRPATAPAMRPTPVPPPDDGGAAA